MNRVVLRILRVVAIVAVCVAPAVAAAAPAVVPATLHDVTGASVDVAALAQRGHLVFVTVKATSCPVCRTQLERLGRRLPRLRACGARFVVLVPGAAEAVAAVARATRFPYPFVAEGAVEIAASVGFATSADELVPGFFAVNAAREIAWEQRGRSAGAFGDGELLAHLGCKSSGDADLLAQVKQLTSRVAAR